MLWQKICYIPLKEQNDLFFPLIWTVENIRKNNSKKTIIAQLNINSSRNKFFFFADIVKYNIVKEGFGQPFRLDQIRNGGGIIPWLITTSCLIFKIQIFGSKSETLGRGFKLSAEDLDIRPTVWVWIRRLVYKSSAEVLGIRYPEEGFIKSGP